MRHSVSLIFLVFLSLPSWLIAQPHQYSFRHISVDNGLSQNSVYAVLQDRKGFMWFGTKDGLNRYDGYTFTIFRNNSNDSTTLSDNFVTKLYEDKRGRLWVGTQNGGINLFDRQREIFYRSEFLTDLPEQFRRFNVTGITEDPFGNLWVASNGDGLFKFTVGQADDVRWQDDVSITRLYHKGGDNTSLHSDIVGYVLCDSRGMVWVVTEGCIQTLHAGLSSAGPHTFQTVRSGVDSTVVFLVIHEDRESNIWFGTSNGLYKYDRKSALVSHVRAHFHDKFIQSICEDTRGTLWLGTFGETRQFFPSDNKYSESPIRIADVLTAGMGHIFRDRTGGLWFGSNGHGVFRYDPNTDRFQSYTEDTEAFLGWKGFSVRSIFQDAQNRLWIGSYGGLFVKDSPHSMFRRVPEFNSLIVRSIAQDHDGTLWLATEGLVHFHPQRGILKWYRHRKGDSTSLRSEAVSRVFIDSSGTVWVIGGGAIGRLNKRSGTFHYKVFGDRLWFGANDPPPVGVYQDHEKRIWFASEKGLFRFSPSTEELQRFIHEKGNKSSINTSVTLSICPDPHEPERFLWIGTAGGGLNRLDITTNQFSAFTESDGLPNNVVYGILSDRNGTLWLSTNKGLVRFDPRTKAVRTYLREDGLQGNEYNAGAYFKSKEGIMYFGGIRGFDRFEPEAIKDSPFIPEIVITGFSLFNRPVGIGDSTRILQQAISETKGVRLTYEQNVFSITFAALDFAVPDKNRYVYKLEGFDADFIPAGANRTATYTSLDPGTYVFRVKGSNSDGVWNEQGTSLEIVILPPFWMTWWFRISVGVILLVIVGGTIRRMESRRFRERLRTMEQEAALEQERLRISKDMHDDIGARLTQIGLLSELSKRAASPREAEEHMERISSAVRETVDAFDEIVWAVNPQYDTLEGVVEYISQYVAEYLGKAGIRCVLHIPEFLSSNTLSAQHRHNLFMAVKESVNNIVKHSGARTAALTVIEQEETVTFTIADDGGGFATGSIPPFSHGVSNLKRRMEDIGGVCEISSAPGNGTMVKLTVRLNKAKTNTPR